MPTKHGTSLMWNSCLPGLANTGSWHQTTVRAWGVPDVTTHAPLRSLGTKARSVCHVRGLGDGDTPTSPTKDTRLEAVRCSAWLGVPPPSPLGQRAPTRPARGEPHHAFGLGRALCLGMPFV